MTSSDVLKAPYPYFGGKKLAAPAIWAALGDVPNFVEPFAGSLGALLARPGGAGKTETINDLDGMISNVWRAIQMDPDAVAAAACWPVSECDLHARHLHLVRARPELTSRLMADPAYFDAKLAGWWIWGACSWIGGGWCSGEGPWHEVDGLFVRQGPAPREPGVKRGLPHLGDNGQGVNRLPGVNRQLPHLGDNGQGVNRLPGEHDADTMVYEWMAALSHRLRRTRIACGDWTRVTGPSVTTKHAGTTGVLLDPPYNGAGADNDVYGSEYDPRVADKVWDWALANGDNPKFRIIYCAYEDGRELPDGWACVAWKASGGYNKQGADANRHREVLYLSPHCLR